MHVCVCWGGGVRSRKFTKVNYMAKSPLSFNCCSFLLASVLRMFPNALPFTFLSQIFTFPKNYFKIPDPTPLQNTGLAVFFLAD